jgi:peptidyl-prolyl cis-trans isomerase B (cyclophilin B)
VPSSIDRERKLARAKIDRQQTRQAQKIRAQRQLQARIGAALLIIVIVVGVGFATNWYGLKSSSDTAAECTWTPVSKATNPNLKDVGEPPTKNIPTTGTQSLAITTSQGVISGSMSVSEAQCTAASFTYLASKHFFDNTYCHRLTTAGIFILQCGDPAENGKGGPTYTIPDENTPQATDQGATGASVPTSTVYPVGTLAVANDNAPNTGSSQFFIVYKASTLPLTYSVFGTIDAAGMAVVNKVAAGGVVQPPNATTPVTDGNPKLKTTITSFVVGKVVAPIPSAAATPSTSTAPSLAPSAPSSSKS